MLEAKLRNCGREQVSMQKTCFSRQTNCSVSIKTEWLIKLNQWMGNERQSSRVLGLCGQLKCCRSRSDSACWGFSVWERSPVEGAVAVEGEQLCLWWVRLSLQTKDPRWVRCHRLEGEQKGNSFIGVLLIVASTHGGLTTYLWCGCAIFKQVHHYNTVDTSKMLVWFTFLTRSDLQWVTVRLKTTIEFHCRQHYCQY